MWVLFAERIFRSANEGQQGDVFAGGAPRARALKVSPSRCASSSGWPGASLLPWAPGGNSAGGGRGAYFALDGGTANLAAAALGGYAVLMAVVQLRFVPLYARLRFSPGFWSFTFSYAAGATDALGWITATKPPGATAYAAVVIALITAWIAAIAARTAVAAARGQLLPQPPPPAGRRPAQPGTSAPPEPGRRAPDSARTSKTAGRQG